MLTDKGSNMVAAFKTNSKNEEKSTDDSEDDEAGTSD